MDTTPGGAAQSRPPSTAACPCPDRQRIIEVSPADPMNAPSANPLLVPWQTPFGLPPFQSIRAEHFPAAFEHALREHREEIDAIAGRTDVPTFENTIAAFDRSGRALSRVAKLF